MTFDTTNDWLAGLPEPLPAGEFEAASLEAEYVPAVAERTSGMTTAGAVLAMGAVAAGATLLGTRPAQAVSPAITFSDAIFGTGDNKVLNYALALEALEANLYQQVYLRLTTGGSIAKGAPNGATLTITGLGVAKTAIDAVYYNTFGEIETGHRNFLNQVLGSASVLNSSTGALKSASFDFGINTLNRAQLAELILDAERTGVGAYLGAIGLISSTNYRQIAASIQGTEARHTSIMYIVINRLAASGVSFPTGATPRNVAPVLAGTSSAGNNDITPQGREATTTATGGQTTIPVGAPATFVPQPTKSATPDNVLAKLSPFINLT